VHPVRVLLFCSRAIHAISEPLLRYYSVTISLYTYTLVHAILAEHMSLPRPPRTTLKGGGRVNG